MNGWCQEASVELSIFDVAQITIAVKLSGSSFACPLP